MGDKAGDQSHGGARGPIPQIGKTLPKKGFVLSYSGSAAGDQDSICGISSYSPPISRIVGGETAVAGEWPWQAMILEYSEVSESFKFSCGGTLIANQWILTAAHCIESTKPLPYYQVALGTTLQNHSDSSAKIFSLDSIICHEEYHGPTTIYEHDICLLKLPANIIYTDYIQPACLPRNGQQVVQGDICTVSGWGSTKETADNSVLQQATVGVISQSDCDAWYGDIGLPIPGGHYCAGHAAGGVDACQGDSGGPLVCMGAIDEPYFLHGVVSFGYDCALPQKPGVYTNVSQYLDWIDETIFSSNPDNKECFAQSSVHSCESVISDNETLLRSPIADDESWLYPPDTICTWYIATFVGWEISLEFICSFHLELYSNQCIDYVLIMDGKDYQREFCGVQSPGTVIIPSNVAAVTFFSDGSVQSSGFVVRVTFVPKSTEQIGPGENTTAKNELATSISSEPRMQTNSPETTSLAGTTQPEMTTTLPDTSIQPDTTTNQIETTTVQPQSITIQSEPTESQPEKTTNQMATKTSHPETTTGKTEATTSHPDIVTNPSNIKTSQPETTTSQMTTTTSQQRTTASRMATTRSQPETTASSSKASTSQVTGRQSQTATRQLYTTTRQPDTPINPSETTTSQAETRTSQQATKTNLLKPWTSEQEEITSQTKPSTSSNETTTIIPESTISQTAMTDNKAVSYTETTTQFVRTRETDEQSDDTTSLSIRGTTIQPNKDNSHLNVKKATDPNTTDTSISLFESSETGNETTSFATKELTNTKNFPTPFSNPSESGNGEDGESSASGDLPTTYMMNTKSNVRQTPRTIGPRSIGEAPRYKIWTILLSLVCHLLYVYVV